MKAITRPFLRTLNAVGWPGGVRSGIATEPAWPAVEPFEAASTANTE